MEVVSFPTLRQALQFCGAPEVLVNVFCVVGGNTRMNTNGAEIVVADYRSMPDCPIDYALGRYEHNGEILTARCNVKRAKKVG